MTKQSPCINSNFLSKCTGVIHGFGFSDFSLSDYLKELLKNETLSFPSRMRDGNDKNKTFYKFFKTNQIHSDDIAILDSSAHSGIIEADAFITGEAGVVCFVRTADCVPILLCDPKKGAVAAVHAGWKGTLLKIVSKTVDQMVTSFGSERKNIIVSIGPSISMDCYEVGPDVAGQFSKNHRQNIRTKNGKTFVDLQKTNRDILKSKGVDNVEIIPICNHCDKRFASYRRDKNDRRRQVNFICLRDIKDVLVLVPK